MNDPPPTMVFDGALSPKNLKTKIVFSSQSNAFIYTEHIQRVVFAFCLLLWDDNGIGRQEDKQRCEEDSFYSS